MENRTEALKSNGKLVYLGAQKKDKNVLRRSKTTTKTYLGAQNTDKNVLRCSKNNDKNVLRRSKTTKKRT